MNGDPHKETSAEALLVMQNILAGLGAAGLLPQETVDAIGQDETRLLGVAAVVAHGPLTPLFSRWVHILSDPEAEALAGTSEVAYGQQGEEAGQGFSGQVLTPAALEAMRLSGLEARDVIPRPRRQALFVTSRLLGTGKSDDFDDLGLNVVQVNAFVECLLFGYRSQVKQQQLPAFKKRVRELRMYVAGLSEEQTVAVVGGAAAGLKVNRSNFLKALRGRNDERIDDFRVLFLEYLAPEQQATWRVRLRELGGEFGEQPEVEPEGVAAPFRPGSIAS